jgi:CubicO group peptidase (beta-lactamase class C family)
MRRRTALKTIFCGAAALGIRRLASGEKFAPDPRVESEVEPAERYAMARVAENYRRRFAAPGLSVAIARDGALSYREAFGFTGRDSRKPLTTSNLFRIASVSKPITSAAIFSLIETGRLRSDDTVFGERGILGSEVWQAALWARH